MKSIKALLLITGSLIFAWLAFAPSAQASTIVFINEIHYDNAGTDAGEAIEIAGPAGTDLAPWTLLLYNGANDTIYETTRLNGVIPDQGNGYGTISFTYPSNGIQNGPADAIALAQVHEFLSYEGGFTALSDLASGITSTDIGISEVSSTPSGNSLQLFGAGNASQDFTWSSPQANTFGAVNTGQSFGGAQLDAGVFINEFHYDNSGTDTGEAIEVAGPSGINLLPWSLQLYNGATSLLYETTRLSGIIPDQNNGYGTFVFNYSTNGIQNGSPDGLALLEITQFLSYEGSFISSNGLASGLTSIDIGVSEDSTAPLGWSLQLTGMGTKYEDFSWAAIQSNTFGDVNTGQVFGSFQPVPEPSTFILLGAGLAGLVAMGIRHRKN